MSLRRLVLWTVVDLLLVFLIGTLCYAISVNFMFRDPVHVRYRGLKALGIEPQMLGLSEAFEQSRQRWRHEVYQDFSNVPADDVALRDWVAGQEGLSIVHVKRGATLTSQAKPRIRLEIDYSAAEDRKPPPFPWKALGYTPEDEQSYFAWVRQSSDNAHVSPDGEFRLLYVAWLQLGVFLVALVRMFFNRKLEVPTATVRDARNALLGLLVGALAFGLYWCYDQYLIHHVGPHNESRGALHTIPSVGWNIRVSPESMANVRPHVVVLIGIIVTALGGPMAQELYLRCGVQTMWTGAGRPWGGVLAATVVGLAVLLLDWRFWPLTVPIGFVFAWLYKRSGSMFAPLVAHLTLNTAVVALVFGMIPGLDHPSNRLPGRWEHVGTRTEHAGGAVVTFSLSRTPLEFTRGGTVDGGEIDGAPSYYPNRFEWIGPDTIRIRYQRLSRLDDRRHLLHQVVFVDYKVEVDDAVLVLTPLGPGGPDSQPVRYRRKE